MPHIVIEHSENVKNEIKESFLMKQVYDVLVESGLFSIPAIKARCTSYNDYILDEDADNFIHITVSILNGRSAAQRKNLSQTIFITAKAAMPNCDRVSVNIHEMDSETYSK